MDPRRCVKSVRWCVSLAALAACGAAQVPPAAPPAAGVVPSQAAARVSSPAPATPATPATPAPALLAPTAAELDAVRPLFARGPVLLVRNADAGADARISLLVRAHAPLATVHRVIATPGEYTTFMPTLRSVEVISEHGSRTAFRFHVAAPFFDVTALCAMNVVSERRVDVSVVQSETGPGGSRWDLTADGPNDTVVALTTWGDPSQGHWLLRQLARRSPAAVAGMNVSTDTVLGLGVARRAEILAGSTAPMRPARGTAPPGPLAPPPAGPWMALGHDTAVVSIGLTAEGAVTQVTVAGWTSGDAAAVTALLRDIPGYPRVWGSFRSVELTGTSAPDRLRYHATIETPLSHLEGDEELRVEGAVITQEGVAGDFAGNSHRWDVAPDPRGGSVVMLTGGADYNRAGALTRLLMDRDPWLMAGFAGSWKIVWLRHLLHAL